MGSPDDRGEVRGSQGALGLQEQQQTERKPPPASQRQERPPRSVCDAITHRCRHCAPKRGGMCSGHSLKASDSECWLPQSFSESLWKWNDLKKSLRAGFTWSFKCQELLAGAVWLVISCDSRFNVPVSTSVGALWLRQCAWLSSRMWRDLCVLLLICYFCFDSSVI